MKIAIIGSGISGLTAAYLLNRKHDITLFEKNNYIGGHTHTHEIEHDGKIWNMLGIHLTHYLHRDLTYSVYPFIVCSVV